MWNSSAYERVETLRRLEGLVDIYLPDFKYSSDFLAKIYQKAIERREQGLELSAAACMAGLPEGEVRHLSGVLAESVRSREPEREMDDYISTILSEYEKRTEQDGDDLLRKAASRRRSKEGG